MQSFGARHASAEVYGLSGTCCRNQMDCVLHAARQWSDRRLCLGDKTPLNFRPASKIRARHHFEVRPILLVKDVGMMPQSFVSCCGRSSLVIIRASTYGVLEDSF